MFFSASAARPLTGTASLRYGNKRRAVKRSAKPGAVLGRQRNDVMLKEQLIGRLLAATPRELERIEAVFKNADTDTAPLTDRRLLTLTQAAETLGCSRMTVFRLLADGRLPAVETRSGRRRIPSAALTEFAAGRQ